MRLRAMPATAWTVTNNGTLLGGESGVFLGGAGSSLTNSKSISGASVYGVELFNGGTVVNQVGGTISGQQSGIAIINNAGTVTNAGIITAQSSGSNGIFLGEGGTVTNQAGGTISGDTGIFIDTFAGTVVNAGTISGSGGNNGPSMGFQRNRHPHAEAANRFGAERRCDWQFRLRRDQ